MRWETELSKTSLVRLGADHRQGLLELVEVGIRERPGLALHDDVAGRLEVDLYVMGESFVVVAGAAEVRDDGGFGRAREGHLSEDAVAAVGPPREGDGVVASVVHEEISEIQNVLRE